MSWSLSHTEMISLYDRELNMHLLGAASLKYPEPDTT